MYQDEKLVCEDCGAEFIFTAGEQEFYAEKGMMLFVLNAVRKLKFHSNLFQEKKSIAKIALQKNTKHKINSKITKQTGLIIKPVCFYLYPNTTV